MFILYLSESQQSLLLNTVLNVLYICKVGNTDIPILKMRKQIDPLKATSSY